MDPVSREPLESSIPRGFDDLKPVQPISSCAAILILQCLHSYSVVNGWGIPGILNTVGIESGMLKYQIHLNTYFYYSSIQMVKKSCEPDKIAGYSDHQNKPNLKDHPNTGQNSPFTLKYLVLFYNGLVRYLDPYCIHVIMSINQECVIYQFNWQVKLSLDM